MRRVVVACSLIAGLIAVGSAPAAGQSVTPSPDEKVTFTIGVTYDLNSANPFRQFDAAEAFVGGLMYDGLLRRSQVEYLPEPELAERWDVSDDGLTWTFVLRDGLTWSDGVPLTAHDFVWTANFVVENDISSWSDGYPYTDSITAQDDRTIVWKTKKPTFVPGLPYYSLLLPEHVWGDFTVQELKQFKNFPDPVVSGAFNLVEWKQGEYWRMEAREDYWEGPPGIDELIFRVYNSDESVIQALLKGAIDHTVIPTAALYEGIQGRPGIGTSVDSAQGFYQMSFNMADDPQSGVHPALLDVRVRDAIARAIDRDALIEKVLRGYGSPGTVPVIPLNEFWHWEPPPDIARTFDPSRARAILDEAGYLDRDGDGIREMPDGTDPLEIRLFVETGDPDAIKSAPFIQSWLRDIGIGVSVRSMDDTKLYDVWLSTLDWDLIIYSWGQGADPDFILSSFTSGQCGYWSDTCYSNPVYDELYEEQQTLIDPDERQAVVYDMQEMLYREVPEIVLWYGNWFEAWRSDRWTGFERWPMPDGAVMWENYYSARSVRPLADATLAEPEEGPPGWVWLAGVFIIAGLFGLAASRRRRMDTYYA